MHGICSIWLQLVDEREQGLHLVLHGDRTQAKRERNTAQMVAMAMDWRVCASLSLCSGKGYGYVYEYHTARYGKRLVYVPDLTVVVEVGVRFRVGIAGWKFCIDWVPWGSEVEVPKTENRAAGSVNQDSDLFFWKWTDGNECYWMMDLSYWKYPVWAAAELGMGHEIFWMC
jgi:hypothetical protein